MKKLILILFILPLFLGAQTIELDVFDPISSEVFDTVDFTRTLADSGVYYNVLNGTPNDCDGFRLVDSALIVERSGGTVMFAGSASVELGLTSASEIVNLVFSLAINDQHDRRRQTPFNFSKKGAIENIALTTKLHVHRGDKIKVMAKCDKDNTVINVSSFNIVFWKIKNEDGQH